MIYNVVEIVDIEVCFFGCNCNQKEKEEDIFGQTFFDVNRSSINYLHLDAKQPLSWTMLVFVFFLQFLS